MVGSIHRLIFYGFGNGYRRHFRVINFAQGELMMLGMSATMFLGGLFVLWFRWDLP
jgi:branched-subunit amino acid ABC-type transport system permease component